MTEVEHVVPSSRFAHVRALDGLRGIAVASVVLFHFLPRAVPGGFLGVDVFFVLSGFLITSLALGEHRSTGRVSAPAFFARRARRLLPAAIVAIVVSVAIALVLDSAAYRGTIRGQAIASLLYVNNWWAIAQNDTYGAIFGAESPLTQFWSLSIEEQFYIAFPVLLLLIGVMVRGRSSPTRVFAITLMGVASLGAVASAVRMSMLYDPLVDPSRLYYGTDTRLQTVLIGVVAGCVLWLWRDGLARHLSSAICTCVTILGTGVLLITAVQGGFLQGWLYRWGFFVLALVAALVVLSVNLHRGAMSRVFETRVLVTLGLYSYGIYLWHWPVAVFLDRSRTGLSGPSLFALRIVVTAAATTLSYVLVERPFRSARGGGGSRRLTAVLRSPRGGVLAAGSVLAAVLLIWFIARPSSATGGTTTAAPTAGRAGAMRVMWTGDSVAWTLAGGRVEFPQPQTFEEVFDPDLVTLWNLATYPCPLMDYPSRSFGAVRSNVSKCLDRSSTWRDDVAGFAPDAVVWSGELFDSTEVYVDGRWVMFGTAEWDELYLDALDRARAAATGSGAKFVLLGQVDPLPFEDERQNEALVASNIWRFAHLRELERRFAQQHPEDTRMIDLHQIMCPTDPCPTKSPDGVVYRPDGIHYSVEGARLMAPVIARELRNVLGRPGD